MNKLSTLFLLALLSVGSALAQKLDTTFRFVDKQGKEVPSGSTITLDQIETDQFGDEAIHSGLFVENTSATEVPIGVKVNLTKISKGSVSFCFPQQCSMYFEPTQDKFQTGTLPPQSKHPLNLEWLLAEEPGASSTSKEGEARITLTLNTMNVSKEEGETVYSVKAEGATVHLVFVQKDPSGLSLAERAQSSSQLYTLSGQPVQRQSLPAGLYLQRQSNGQTRKVLLP